MRKAAVGIGAMLAFSVGVFALSAAPEQRAKAQDAPGDGVVDAADLEAFGVASEVVSVPCNIDPNP